MTRHKSIVAVLSAVLLTTTLAFAADDGEWIQLFNGKNLDGWKIKVKGHELGDNYNDTFRVEDGVLKVCYDKYEKYNG